MTQQVQISFSDGSAFTLRDDTGVPFTVAGLKKFLNEVEVREGYLEGVYGPELQIPITTILRYVEGSSVEVVSE